MQRTQCNYRYRCRKFVIVESFNSILRICFLLNHDQENITRYFHGLIFSFSWLQMFLQHSTFSPSLYNPIYNRWICNAFAIYITRNKMLLPTLSLYAYTFLFWDNKHLLQLCKCFILINKILNMGITIHCTTVQIISYLGMCYIRLVSLHT